MTYQHDGVVYKSRRQFFQAMNPDVDITTMSKAAIDQWMYHNISDYREAKQRFYREKYRVQKGFVREYQKFNPFGAKRGKI